MKVTLVVRGLSQLKHSLDLMPKRVMENLHKEVVSSAIAIQEDARKNCPVITGRLRNSIDFTESFGELEAYVGTNVEYAGYVNAKKPFLTNAALKEEPRFVRNIMKALKQKL